jgi:hypothetical protein
MADGSIIDVCEDTGCEARARTVDPKLDGGDVDFATVSAAESLCGDIAAADDGEIVAANVDLAPVAECFFSNISKDPRGETRTRTVDPKFSGGDIDTAPVTVTIGTGIDLSPIAIVSIAKNVDPATVTDSFSPTLETMPVKRSEPKAAIQRGQLILPPSPRPKVLALICPCEIIAR